MQDSDVEKQWSEYYPKVYGYFFRRLNSREDVEDLTCKIP
jgi:DNA-directed RNA polymerase specialized sigma24 family protein